MARLRGNAEGTMDVKGRATVPTKFRPMFEGQKDLVLWEPRGLEEPFLMLATAEYFDSITDREYALADKRDRQKVLRQSLGHMEEIELDSAGRFVIPDKYCGKAGFRRGEKLFFLANRDYMEIWSLEVWRQLEAEWQEGRSLVDYTPDPAGKQAQEESA